MQYYFDEENLNQSVITSLKGIFEDYSLKEAIVYCFAYNSFDWHKRCPSLIACINQALFLSAFTIEKKPCEERFLEFITRIAKFENAYDKSYLSEKDNLCKIIWDEEVFTASLDLIMPTAYQNYHLLKYVCDPRNEALIKKCFQYETKLCLFIENDISKHYKEVCSWFEKKSWTELPSLITSLFHLRDSDSVNSCFFIHGDTVFPLFNPSFLLSVCNWYFENHKIDYKLTIYKAVKDCVPDDSSLDNLIIDCRDETTNFTGIMTITDISNRDCYLLVDESKITLDEITNELNSWNSRKERKIIRNTNGIGHGGFLLDNYSLRIIALQKPTTIYSSLPIFRCPTPEKTIISLDFLIFSFLFGHCFFDGLKFEYENSNANYQSFVDDHGSQFLSWISNHHSMLTGYANENTSICFTGDEPTDIQKIKETDLFDFPFHSNHPNIKNPNKWIIMRENSVLALYAKNAGGFYMYGFAPNGEAQIFIGTDAFRYPNNRNAFITLVKIFSSFINETKNLWSFLQPGSSILFHFCPQENLKNPNHKNYIRLEKTIFEKYSCYCYSFSFDEMKYANDSSKYNDRRVEIELLKELIQPLKAKYIKQIHEIESKLKSLSSGKKTTELFSIESESYIDIQHLSSVGDEAKRLALNTVAEIASSIGIISNSEIGQDQKELVTAFYHSLYDNVITKIKAANKRTSLIYISDFIASVFHEKQIEMIKQEKAQSTSSIEDVRIAQQKFSDCRHYLNASFILLELITIYGSDDGIDLSVNDRYSLISEMDQLSELANMETLFSQNILPVETTISFDDFFVPNIVSTEYESQQEEIAEQKLFHYHESTSISPTKNEIDKLESELFSFFGINCHYYLALFDLLRRPDLNEGSFTRVGTQSFTVTRNALRQLMIENNFFDNGQYINNFIDTLVYNSEKASDLLKSISIDKKYLPFTMRNCRKNRLLFHPLIPIEKNHFLFSPKGIEALYHEFIDGWFEYLYPINPTYLPPSLSAVLNEIKERQEDSISTDLGQQLSRMGYAPVYIEKELSDFGWHQAGVSSLGDYDLIAIDQKKMIVILGECKIIRKCGSLYETIVQQEEFFKDDGKKNHQYGRKFNDRYHYFENHKEELLPLLGIKENVKQYQIKPYIISNKNLCSLFHPVDYELVLIPEFLDICKSSMGK